MRKQLLIGATKNKEIVFVEIELSTNRKNEMKFTASFDVVTPFIYDDAYLLERLKSNLEDYDKRELYDLCEYYDCSPSQLSETMFNVYTIEDIIDISLYPNSITVNGEEWYFESSCCGQCDTREEIEFYVNEEVYNRIHEIWDEYHLKEIPQNIVDEVNDIINELETIDEEEWIINFIEREC